MRLHWTDRVRVPKTVQANALKGLELVRTHRRGGTDVGRRMARALSCGAVTVRQAVKVSEYFPRHQWDRLDDPQSNGYIAWLLWGGWDGWKWSARVKEAVTAHQKRPGHSRPRRRS